MSESEPGADAAATPRRTTNRKPGRRDDIMAAAQALFSEQGYHATSVRQIADAVGIRVASLYTHIDGKEDLLNEAMIAVARRFRDAASDARDRGGSPSDQLSFLVRAHLEIVDVETELARILNLEWREVEVASELRSLRSGYEDILEQILRQGSEAGEFRLTQHPKLAVYFIATALNSVCLWYQADGPLGIDQIAVEYSSLVLNSVGARG